MCVSIIMSEYPAIRRTIVQLTGGQWLTGSVLNTALCEGSWGGGEDTVGRGGGDYRVKGEITSSVLK